MNPDNPYAAPQTLEPQLDLATLPIAELQLPRGQRRSFPSHSTAQLRRLFEKSQRLEAMLLIWLLIWFLTLAAMPLVYLRGEQTGFDPIAWVVLSLVTARLLCSLFRMKLGRWYMFVADAALIFACLAGIGWGIAMLGSNLFLAAKLLLNCTIGLVALTIIVLAYRSCRMLREARDLFQPVCIQHDDLSRELAYRQENHID